MSATNPQSIARQIGTRLLYNAKRVFWTFIIGLRWSLDRSTFGFAASSWPLYLVVNRCYAIDLGHLPNLRAPCDFNEKMAWLKLFDQVEDKIRCSDKLAVREYVRATVGQRYLTTLYAQAETYADLRALCEQLKWPYVVKTNHVSGAVFFVDPAGPNGLDHFGPKVDASLRSVFGWTTGEWPYTFIAPRVFAEEQIPGQDNKPPPDYKFHCTAGEVRFLQYIYDRGHGTKEAIVLPDGTVTHMHFDQHMQHTEDFVKPHEWDELLVTASRLSRPFRYVRVDLYATAGRVLFGELTFFPLGGLYTTQAQRELGLLLPLDADDKRPAWVAGPGKRATRDGKA